MAIGITVFLEVKKKYFNMFIVHLVLLEKRYAHQQEERLSI